MRKTRTSKGRPAPLSGEQDGPSIVQASKAAPREGFGRRRDMRSHRAAGRSRAAHGGAASALIATIAALDGRLRGEPEARRPLGKSS